MVSDTDRIFNLTAAGGDRNGSEAKRCLLPVETPGPTLVYIEGPRNRPVALHARFLGLLDVRTRKITECNDVIQSRKV